MQEAVEHGPGQRLVGKDRPPGGEGLVAGDDRRTSFVALADELKQPCRRRFVELHVAEFVDDEELRVDERTLLMARYAVDLRHMYLIEKVLRAHEIRSVPSLQRLRTEARRQMRFSDAWWPEEHNILCSFDKSER